MGRASIIAFGFALIALTVCFPSLAADSEAALLVDRVNSFRAAHGLAPVALETRLSAAAQRHAEAMAASGVFSHDGPDGTLTERMVRVGYAYMEVAENIGGGTPTAEETVDAWVQSPGHARNLLLAPAHNAGVGHARAARPDAPFADYWSLILAEPVPP
jgi:uncharacterized protein YkwD